MVETEEGQAVTGRRLVNAPDVDTRQLPRPTRLFLSTGQNRKNEYLVQKEIAAKAGITTTPHMGSGVSVFQAATLQCAAVVPRSIYRSFRAGYRTDLRRRRTLAGSIETVVSSCPIGPVSVSK
jgi:hypothetical protein